MNDLEKEIRNLLCLKFGYEEGDVNLFVAKPIAEYFGEVSEPKAIAAQIFLALQKAESVPPEVSDFGVGPICYFLSDLDYGTVKQAFMEAAAIVKNEQ